MRKLRITTILITISKNIFNVYFSFPLYLYLHNFLVGEKAIQKSIYTGQKEISHCSLGTFCHLIKHREFVLTQNISKQFCNLFIEHPVEQK